MAPEAYAALRHLHRACAVVSIAGFALRFGAAAAGQGWVRGRVARTLPHVIDTLLLASALALAFGAGFTPANAPWLATKIVLLLVYIGLGMVALSPRRPWRWRVPAAALALAVALHIVAVALTKRPLGWLV
ncbi:MAG: SirB2 family protein [Rubrivivax sp.]